MKHRYDYYCFRFIRSIVKMFYPKIKVEGYERIPKNDAVIVANHCKMNGPICAELFMPDNCYIWCAGEMMKLKEVPHYAYNDFWSEKPRFLRPFYKLLSYIISPLSVCVFNNARTLPVYHDMRVLSTFKTSVGMLKDGKCMVVFPEKNEQNNNILCHFQDRFVDVAKLFYKSSGKIVSFVPMYIAPNLKKIVVGEPIEFDADNDIEKERKRICDTLSERITKMAVSLPQHVVIPYNNIPKRRYLTNKDVNEVAK